MRLVLDSAGEPDDADVAAAPAGAGMGQRPSSDGGSETYAPAADWCSPAGSPKSGQRSSENSSDRACTAANSSGSGSGSSKGMWHVRFIVVDTGAGLDPAELEVRMRHRATRNAHALPCSACRVPHAECLLARTRADETLTLCAATVRATLHDVCRCVAGPRLPPAHRALRVLPVTPTVFLWPSGWQLLNAPSAMFQQVGMGQLQGQGGSGLGLHLTRQLLQLHDGGSLALTSRGRGHGSQFEMRLGLRAAQPQPSSQPQAAEVRDDCARLERGIAQSSLAQRAAADAGAGGRASERSVGCEGEGGSSRGSAPPSPGRAEQGAHDKGTGRGAAEAAEGSGSAEVAESAVRAAGADGRKVLYVEVRARPLLLSAPHTRSLVLASAALRAVSTCGCAPAVFAARARWAGVPCLMCMLRARPHVLPHRFRMTCSCE